MVNLPLQLGVLLDVSDSVRKNIMRERQLHNFSRGRYCSRGPTTFFL